MSPSDTPQLSTTAHGASCYQRADSGRCVRSSYRTSRGAGASSGKGGIWVLGHKTLARFVVDQRVDQVLRPEPSAQIHTVVTDEARNQGIGSALLEAAQDWAAAQGIGYLSAGIDHRNADAVRFYGRHGYADSGRLLGRRVTA
ncbi:GNAT family N-acetyltransferase [Micromonospora phytophila]|uniref:GNAT family N-acetyltransferase n=1 Tax=Micromonospora phytophila TaxID=709888 RepID=UPI0035587B91